MRSILHALCQSGGRYPDQQDDCQRNDFPNVTLVGSNLLDNMSLHVPDFHASERTFQLGLPGGGTCRAGKGTGQVSN